MSRGHARIGAIVVCPACKIVFEKDSNGHGNRCKPCRRAYDIATRQRRAAARVPLTQSRLKELLIYDPDTGIFRRRIACGIAVAGSTPGNINAMGYLDISIGCKRYYAHRLAWLYVYGEWPSLEIDHINCDRLDNRISNLRDVTHHQNMNNLRFHREGTAS
jgi:hypothetical protein